MRPDDLTPAQFVQYPPEAQQLAIAHLAMLKHLPLALLPLLLRETIAYDWKFPIERKDLEHQYDYLTAMTADDLRGTMAPFAQLKLTAELELVDWVNKPGEFSERLTAHLWASHQIDAFRTASVNYVHKLNASAPVEKLPAPRLAMVAAGQGVAETQTAVFRKLRPYGVHFTNVKPEDGLAALREKVAARARQYPQPFAHWHIDGANISPEPGIASVCFDGLAGVRSKLVDKMRRVMQPGGGGPETLRTMLAEMRPEDVGLSGAASDAVLNRFAISVLTEGSGTQIFATTFVQWSAREVLRRAQPLTLLARFTPRFREQSMKDLLAGTPHQPMPDPDGSLVDAGMGAFYTWINLQRLAGAEQSRFLVWFEDHREAVAVGPGMKPNTTSSEETRLEEIIGRMES
ncbi:MAG TPA: hypothetical protein VHZ07_06350 [Bryobacteraceae bacterium]|jgi:hypothetical protein|nr:hypothetical protein [Bryobacteraceae bacterium]